VTITFTINEDFKNYVLIKEKLYTNSVEWIKSLIFEMIILSEILKLNCINSR
jgi:hypothetical protein